MDFFLLIDYNQLEIVFRLTLIHRDDDVGADVGADAGADADEADENVSVHQVQLVNVSLDNQFVVVYYWLWIYPLIKVIHFHHHHHYFHVDHQDDLSMF